MGKNNRGDELPVGSDFGGYEIVRKLGAGAFGAVYEALKLPLRKRTALKVLHKEFLRHPEVVQRFLREAEIVAQIEHPHIVGVFDVGVHDEQPYIAMEFLDGEALAQRLEREHALPVEDAVDLMLAVMSAVATVHEKGIVHRDLKPDNIFIARLSTGGTQPKLLDFGIAKVREAERSLTVTNAVLGTPYYMSPEQAQESKHIDAQSDQWSLAVILFECLTGACPFQGDSLLALLNAITAKPIPKLREVAPGMPEGLEATVLRAMERSAPARWPSVRAFGAALLPFASPGAQAQWATFYGRTSMAPRVSVPMAAAPAVDAFATTGLGHSETLEPATRSSLGLGARPKRRTAWIAGSAAVAVALLGGGWAATRRTGETAPVSAALVPPRGRPTTTEVPTTTVRMPTEPAETAVADAGVAAAVAAPAVAAVAAAPVVAAPIEEAPRQGRRGRHAHGGARARRPTPRDCPNGVCAPED